MRTTHTGPGVDWPKVLVWGGALVGSAVIWYAVLLLAQLAWHTLVG